MLLEFIMSHNNTFINDFCFSKLNNIIINFLGENSWKSYTNAMLTDSTSFSFKEKKI